MIFLAKNKTNNEDYKVFESSVENSIEEAAKHCPDYDFIASFDSLKQAYIARNAAILGMSTFTYNLLFTYKDDKKELSEIVNSGIEDFEEYKHFEDMYTWLQEFTQFRDESRF